MNIKLDVSKEVLNNLKADNIPMNLAGSVLLILMALYHDNYNFLEYLDDKDKEKQIMLLYVLLYRKGYIDQTNESEMEEALYKLTKKGENFIRYAEATSLVVQNTNENDLAVWIKEYNSLFPEPIRGQRNLRGNEESCMARMQWFLKKYKYTKEHILAATEEYINSQATSTDGHKYTMTSDYFIKKGNGVDCTSRLAQACETYDPNNLTAKQDYTRDTI
ncbi:MAG: hypothetical protein ACEQSQ_06080 [Candidatus Paceibacteria bacterium]